MFNRKIPLSVFLVIILFTAAAGQDKAGTEPNFNGVWRMESATSMTILPLDKFTSWYEQKIRRISIRQDKTKFAVGILSLTGGSEMDMEFDLNGKGETNESPFRIHDSDKNQTFTSNRTFKSSTKLDGRTIISKADIKIDLYGTPITVKRVVEWKLSKDGTELSERVTLDREGGIRGGGYSKSVSEVITKISFTRKYKLEK
jgi:hypothetical protein